MPTIRQYPNAPITEALIDFRVTYGPGISLENLKAFGEEIKQDYPNASNRDLFEGTVGFDAGGPVTQSSRTTVGYIFHSTDKKQGVQARLDGFTFSRFRPYQNWDGLIAEAKRLWTIFVRVVRPVSVTRVAVRYINQIDMPFKDGTLQFEDYLKAFPRSGVEGEVFIEEFLMRLVMPQPDLGAKLIFTETLLPPEGNHIGIILDFDLFKETVNLNPEKQDVWNILDTFRDRKNQHFEGSITDAARELFKN